MTSVTNRVKSVPQPRGGYLSSKLFVKQQLDSKRELVDEPNMRGGSALGITVDYFSRFMLGENPRQAWQISLAGAEMIDQSETADKLLAQITGLNDQSLQAAYRLAGFDVVRRSGLAHFQNVMGPDFELSTADLTNLTILVERVMAFFDQFGKPIHSGMVFAGGYTNVISTGDADFMASETLWDLKVVKSNVLNKNNKLQILVYYLMGLHSIDEADYLQLDSIGFFNPRENAVYRCKISTIPDEVIDEVTTKVIGY
ncbi:hypothetical protein [Lactobacillus sp. Sy-1]|uniref:hypothetical protein n=1 Tax=Lactobacillus sp. Sy-1 TaxID=2109645 RepID=UPI001C5B9020|nr:hypothetical protein [Lactobacillus sp. Sy-1]